MKKIILPVLLCVVLPLAAFLLTIFYYGANLGKGDIVSVLSLIFLILIGIEIVLTIVYLLIKEKIQTIQEIRQETRIEQSGRLFNSATDDAESGYVDPIMQEVIDKKNFILMNRKEILAFCETLNYNVKTQITLRETVDLPDIIYTGDNTYCFLYEHKGIIKLTIKNSSLMMDNIKAIHPEIVQIGKVSDWYDVILDDSFTDNDQVKELLTGAYEYVVSAHFSFVNGSYVKNKGIKNNDTEVEKIVVESVKEDEKIAAIVEKKQKLSTLTLTSREIIADYVEENIKGDYPSYIIRRKGFSLYSLKAQTRSYGLLYERENVVKMWLRLDLDFAKTKMQEHSTITRAKFPKGKDWYTIIIDDSFDEDFKISELIWTSYYYVCNEYLIKKGVKPIRIE